MRHRNRRGKLGRKSEHRMMMLRNLATSLFESERIKTTLPKAKQLRPFAEKLITLARKQDLHARRQAATMITKPSVLQKLFDEIGKRFADTKGGYTRIIPYRQRWGDGAEEAFIELKDAVIGPQEEGKGKGGDKKKKASTKGAAPEAKAEEGKKKKKTAPEAEEKKDASAKTKKTSVNAKEDKTTATQGQAETPSQKADNK